MERLWAPWRMSYIGGSEEAVDGCFLCAMAAGPVGDPHGLVIERGELTLTVLNRFPYASGHLMVVPREHVPDLLHLPPATTAALLPAVQRALQALTDDMQPQGFNIGINHGFSAGGSVEDHLHIHVVPRWSGDTNFMPVLADVKILPEALEATARRLAARLRDGTSGAD